ncbi:chemerin-like receptor 1 [Mantella aurantiaca]
MDSLLIPNLTSLTNSSEGSQGPCPGITKEDDHIARNINISSAAICSLIFLLGITANGYVIWMKVYRLEKTFRSMLSIHFYISGFVWSLFLLLNITRFASGDNWPFGSFMCQLNSFMFHLYMFISAFVLTLYSIDYCIVVIYPFKYNYYRRPYLASREAIVGWIVAFSFSVPYFVFKATYDCHGAIRCLDRLDDTEMTDIWKRGQKAIRVIAFVVGYCVPLLIIIVCFVIAAIVYHRKKTSKYTPALKLIFTFQALFAVSWLPYHVFSLLALSLAVSGKNDPEGVAEMVEPMTISLASLSCCVNPILYVFTSPDLKRYEQKPYSLNVL